MDFRCPHCQSPIYSRKHKICGVCEKPLPENVLLSKAQIQLLKDQLAKEEKEAKAFNRQLDDVGPHDHGGDIGNIAGF
jgi:hypothetical protein